MRISDWSSDVCSSDLILLEDQVVPVGDDVVDGTAAGAERNTAVHAARALLLGLGIGQGIDEFIPVLEPRLGRLVGFFDALKLKKAGNFRSEEHTSELQSLMRISYAVFCLQHTIKTN